VPTTSLKVEAHETHDGHVRISLDTDEGEHAQGILDRDHALLIAIDLLVASSVISRAKVIRYLEDLLD
jgi:hypothetical protein